MSWLRAFRYSFLSLWHPLKIKLLLLVALPALSFVGFFTNVALPLSAEQAISGMDGFLYFIKGTEYFSRTNDVFPRIPIEWLATQITLMYCVGFSLGNEFTDRADSVLVRFGSVKKWWLSKCLAVAASILAYYAICVMFFSIAAVLLGWNAWEVDPSVALYGHQGLSALPVSRAMLAEMFAASVLASTGLCFIQMLLSLLSQPPVALMGAIAYAIISVFSEGVLFCADAGMVLRSSAFVQSGGITVVGSMACALVILLCAAGGTILLARFSSFKVDRH